MHSIKIASKVLIGLLFSLTVGLVFFTSALFGTQAEDTVRLIVTEATGMQREMVIFQANLQPLAIHNVLWLCLAGFGFMLIFLYFIDHSFRTFLAPGVLCLMITIFTTIFVLASQDHMLHYAGPLADLYIETALVRFRVAALSMALFGLALIVISYHGDRFLKRS